MKLYKYMLRVFVLNKAEDGGQEQNHTYSKYVLQEIQYEIHLPVMPGPLVLRAEIRW